MKVNVPIFKEVKKTPTNIDALESKQKFMQGAMIFNKESNSWTVTDIDGDSVFISCHIVNGSDLA